MDIAILMFVIERCGKSSVTDQYGKTSIDKKQLHGATAILESRAAVAQGERIQVLTYLAVAYLPIGTVSVSINQYPRPV